MKVQDLVIQRGHTIIGPLTVEFPTGQVTIIAGPSCSGKSTLCLALAGLLEPTSGVVEAPRVGLVPQNPREWLNPGQTAQAALLHAAAAAVRSTPGWDHHHHSGEDLHALLRRCRLAPELLEQRISHLSGGQAARVAIARALAAKPEALVCDEPTASLDVSNAAQIARTLMELAEEGTAVVWATHDLPLAQAVAPDAPQFNLNSAVIRA